MLKSLQKKKTILRVVDDNPGMGFLDIQKVTGYANGVLSHHLKILEEDNSIRIRRTKRKMWAFSINTDPNEDTLRIYLRKETCQKILLLLIRQKTAKFSDIRDEIKKSPGTTSITLKILIEKGLVKKIPGFTVQYCLEDHDKTVKIVNTAKISKTDVLKDRFADTFSYL